MKRNIEKIALKDGRFSPEIVKFVYEGLNYSVEKLVSRPDHISGQTLCRGLKMFAIENWGRLAKLVLNNSGVKTTRDFGEIVYLMIENKWMSAQPTDTIEDFDNVYDFQTVFKDEFKF
ncbi:MAG TPA: hypothetical protein PLP05_04165 [Sedimentisphaerales bacterium]|nr:hypothetical protein [Sedimentisphaerales bacterium]